MWYSSLVSSSTPFFCSTMAPDVGIWNLKNKLGTRAHEARVLLSHVSLLPTLKPYVTQSLNHLLPRAKHTHKPNLSISLLPLSISLSPSQSKAISTQILSFFLSILQILSFSLSISRSASFSVAVSLLVSLSRAIAHALGLPLTRYVSLSLHVQLVGIFGCKFVIFMHTLILGFDQFS